MQGQDTLVVIGGVEDEEYRVGANASIMVPNGGDAKFIGVDSRGLPEMRQAVTNDKDEANQKGGQLLDSVSRARESEDSLKIRVSARTASLNQIVDVGAFGLKQSLQMAAVWMGEDPEKVIVEPNKDFADNELSSKTLVEWMTARALGAPISKRTIHDRMRDHDLTDLEFEEELAELEKEKVLEDDDEGTDGDGPVEDDDDAEEQ